MAFRTRNEFRFRKEALYFSRKSMARLAAKEESPIDMAFESDGASYLRRRPSQGKAGPRKPG